MLVLPERERTKKGVMGSGNQGRNLQNPAGAAQSDQRGNPGKGKYNEQVHRNGHPGTL